MGPKTVIAVLVAGIGATLIDNLAAQLLFGLDFMKLTTQAPGRFGVALAGAALLPFLLGAVRGAAGYVVSAVVLAVGAAVLAKLVFGYGAPWPTVLTLTSIYAVSAIVLYKALR